MDSIRCPEGPDHCPNEQNLPQKGVLFERAAKPAKAGLTTGNGSDPGSSSAPGAGGCEMRPALCSEDFSPTELGT
jgi:hypothetical protein